MAGPSALRAASEDAGVDEDKAGTGTMPRASQTPPCFKPQVGPSHCWRGASPKHKHLLSDPDIKRWYDNVCRGSKVTADVYLRRLGSLCISQGLDGPQELLQRASAGGERWTCNFLMDVVTRLEGEGKAGSYIASNLKAAKSWLAHNGIEVRGESG